MKLQNVDTGMIVVGDKTYTLEFPLPAVAKAEMKLGANVWDYRYWLNMKPEAIPVILEAGLSLHHPDVTPEDLEAICACLNPETINVLRLKLAKLAFPKTMTEVERQWDESQAQRPRGETASPNV